jgi:hypothetical protein
MRLISLEIPEPGYFIDLRNDLSTFSPSRVGRTFLIMNSISIENNTPAEWQKFSALLDCVPDPMVIRTAELFLNGKSGCRRLDTDSV